MFNKELVLSEKFQEDFIVRQVNLFGDDCVLIFPKAFPKWDESNKIYRSSVWRLSDEKLVSASWKKFTNLGEQPEFEPMNVNSKIEFLQKLDGSTLVSSKLNGNLINRTRGTVDASQMENGDELPLLISKYPNLFDNEYINSEKYTILTEWYSPRNIVVLREAVEPKLWLTGIIDHSDYSYLSQDKLDELSLKWKIDRPKRYDFNTFEEMTSSVEQFQNCEGVVIYSNNGQVLKKVKSLRYLYLHKIKSNLNTEESILDLYLESGSENYSDFQNKIIKDFDYEIFTQIQPEISKIFDAKKEVDSIVSHMKSFVENLRGLSRKEQAMKIMSAYGETNRKSYLFLLLDGKQLTSEMYKKLYFQVMKYN